MTVWRTRGKTVRTVLCCVVYDSCAQWYATTHTWAVLEDECWFMFRFSFCVCLSLASCVIFWFSLDYFVLVLCVIVALSLVSSVLRQETGWKECLRNDLRCVEWDSFNQSMSHAADLWTYTQNYTINIPLRLRKLMKPMRRIFEPSWAVNLNLSRGLRFGNANVCTQTYQFAHFCHKKHKSRLNIHCYGAAYVY